MRAAQIDSVSELIRGTVKTEANIGSKAVSNLVTMLFALRPSMLRILFCCLWVAILRNSLTLIG